MKKVKKELDKKEKEDRNYSTRGWGKLWKYYVEITKKEYFQNKIIELRKQHKIPEEGYKHPKPPQTYTTPPPEWQYQFRGIGQSYIQERVKILDELKLLCEKYGLHYVDWLHVIEDYVFYNKLVYLMDENAYNLCLLADLANNKRKSTFSRDFELWDDKFYPIAIRISPYASKRDILNYVAKMAPMIKEYQKPYINPNIKIGKVKKKKYSAQKRNEIVWKNKDFGVEKIKIELEKEFPNKIFGYEEIYTIISLEKKRRTTEF